MTVSMDPDRQCRGKRTFSTKGEAKRAVRRMQTTGNQDWNPRPLVAYRCPHGDHFHFGHLPPWLRAAEALAAAEPEEL